MASKIKRRKNHFNDILKKEFPFLIQINKNNDTVVKCSICNVEFNLAVGGRSAINKHCLSNKHKSCLDAVASSSKVTGFVRKLTFTFDEKKLAVSEGTFAFHTVCHSQSFRSMDCTSRIIRKLFNAKFTCARTKCEMIVVNVFKTFSNELLERDLNEAKFITLLSDASNHKEIKLYPILVRYFNFKSGVQIKILQLDSIKGETSEILSEHIFNAVSTRNLSGKIFAISADNTNTNFGGLLRKGENNLHKKLIRLLEKPIIGVGCNAHILSNAINTAASVMSINVEVIFPQIYLHFSRFTVRVTILQQFCEEADIEYRKLLGYSKVRWLALTPAIERIITLFEPLKFYFLSIEKCPKILQDFFQNEASETILYFVHNQAVLFNSAIKKIEANNISIPEVTGILSDFKDMFLSRYNSGFIPIVVDSLIKKLEETNPGTRKKITKEFISFYKDCYDYMEQWTESLKNVNALGWTLLRKEVNWGSVKDTIKFMEINNIQNINDNELFDEIRRMNLYCVENEKFSKWAEDQIEVHKRWIEIFVFFKNENIPCENLKIIVEAAMCLPGTNASVERTFSIINDFWSCEKSRLSIDVLAAVITTKENLKMYNCEQFANMLSENDNLIKAIHSSNKYIYKL